MRSMPRRILLIVVLSVVPWLSLASQDSELVRKLITPVRVVWMSDVTGIQIKNPEYLLIPGNGQADLSGSRICKMINSPGHKAGMILDFGQELQGGIQIITGFSDPKNIRVRVRLGESVAETLSEIGENGTATNDHANRDFELVLPWLGRIESGNSGFRFVRIDLLDETADANIKEINAISVYRDVPLLGSFRCNDDLINKIWETGVRTVHLNMQEFLWDGIKRDRLVWVGDMHPEVSTILSCFGNHRVIAGSLDLSRDITPVSEWMNGISSYSMWWVIIQRDLYRWSGDLAYLKEQAAYLKALLSKFCSMVSDDGYERLDGNRFLDWPSSGDKQAIDAGYQGLLLMALRSGAELCDALSEQETRDLCLNRSGLMEKVRFQGVASKQAAALLSLSGLMSPGDAEAIIAKGGAKGFSTFYGFYMLHALALAGNYDAALAIIRDYWGAMIKLGATTFWEDFNIEWLANAGRIDEMPDGDHIDVHGTYGDFCYKGYRHSYCHGWASGPTSWLSEYVLGIRILEPGCKRIQIKPHLGDLQWVEGSYPTPSGIVKVKHERRMDGTVSTWYEAPPGVSIEISN